MAEIKITKRDIFNRVIERCGDDTEIVECMENEIALLDKKQVKAKERAAAKRAEGDELQAAVLSTLTTEPQTREEILAHFENADGELTVAKIQPKLNNLVEAGKASKTKVKTEDGKTKTAWTLPVDAE